MLGACFIARAEPVTMNPISTWSLLKLRSNYNLKNFAIAFDINFQLVLKSASFDQKLHKNSEK